MQLSEDQQQTRPILAVEDDPSIGAMLMETITQFTPYPLVLATHSEQALQVVKGVKPILFILNYHLPLMNGIELYDRLHAIKELEHVPAMMVSAVLPERELQARHIVGIHKPFELSTFLDAIEVLVAEPCSPESKIRS